MLKYKRSDQKNWNGKMKMSKFPRSHQIKIIIWMAIGVAVDIDFECTRTHIPFLSCYFSVKIHFLFSRSQFLSLSLTFSHSVRVWCYVACNWCVCYAHFKYNFSSSSSSFHSKFLFPTFDFSFVFIFFPSFLLRVTEVSLFSSSLSCFGIFLKA